MIDYNDYIRYKRPSGIVVLKYRLYCHKCGNSKGYQTKDKDVHQCRSCASKRDKTEQERLKISQGVSAYYHKIHDKQILKNTPLTIKVSKSIKMPVWKRIRRECKSRDKKFSENKRFNFTDEELISTLSKPCIYCDDVIKIGLDRIDNDIGHTKENCVPCCHLCNMTRGNRFTVEEFKVIGKQIKIIKQLKRILK